MVLKSPDKVHHYYVCSTSLYEKQCSSHSINEKKLVEAVTEAILHYISVLVELKDILAYVKTVSIPRQRLLEEDKKLEVLEKESQRILNIKVKLYDSFAEEILDRTEFETFKAKYDQSLEEIRQAMECQQREIRNLQETLEKQQEWLEYFLEYQDRTEVDRLMLVNLVKRIEVYEQKRITIHFWFEDEFEKVVGDADTLAGMLLEIKGEFPALHEKVTYHNYEFEVLEMDSRRILKVKFTILPKEMDESESKE